MAQNTQKDDLSFEKNPLKQTKKILTDMVFWKTLGWTVGIGMCTVCTYYAVTFYPQQKYFRWLKERDIFMPLPDVFLDLARGSIPNVNNATTKIADMIPGIFVATGIATCIYFRYLDIFTHYAFSVVFLMFNNMIVESVTTVPSSYGFRRCAEYLADVAPLENQTPVPNISDWAKLNTTEVNVFLDDQIERPWYFNPMGGCTAMVWSGHTVHAVIGMYAILTCMERAFPKFKAMRVGCGRLGFSLKSCIMIVTAILEACLLLTNFGHYTMDIYVGFLMVFLVLSNDKLKYLMIRANIFLPRDRWVMQLRFSDSMEYERLVQVLAEKHPEILESLVNEDGLSIRARAMTDMQRRKMESLQDVAPSDAKSPTIRMENTASSSI